jgi:hypothetical protein
MRSLANYTADLTVQQRSLAFVHWLGCLHETRGRALAATERYQQRFPGVHHDVITKALDFYETKAAVLPGDTTTPAWAGALVGVQPFVDAFLALARSESLLGRIPGLRTAPFGVRVPVQTAGASYRWVKQGDSKPASKFAFADGVQLTATKAGAIVVTTAELLRLAVPGAGEKVRDDLVDGLVEFTDKTFLDPAAAAVADTSPASITNATTPVVGTGNIVADIAALVAAFYAGRPGAQAPVLVMGGGPASTLRGGDGRGGPDVPIVISGAAAALNIAVMLDPRGVLVADAGVDVDVSQYAAVQMDSAPTAPSATTVFTDLWSNNLAGLRVERTMHWTTVPGSVKYLTLV